MIYQIDVYLAFSVISFAELGKMCPLIHSFSVDKMLMLLYCDMKSIFMMI